MKRALLAVILLLACVSLQAAPTPLEKRPRQKSRLCVLGEWRNHWGSSTYHVIFRVDGTYTAGYFDAPPWWVGLWKLEGRTLTVREWHVTGSPDGASVWSVDLCDGYAGEADYRHSPGVVGGSRTTFSLVRPR